ncbi:hypothetical protein [Nocardia sp. NPDC049149]|uniref:hypothetical protein n=1 Tax=Nocardia sp. NPDC049149 TaxID=3364315 RepID=UPI003715AF08
MDAVELVRDNQCGILWMVLVRALGSKLPGNGLSFATVATPVHGMFQPFVACFVGTNVTMAGRSKTSSAYPTPVSLIEMPGHAWYLASAQSIGYFFDKPWHLIP